MSKQLAVKFTVVFFLLSLGSYISLNAQETRNDTLQTERSTTTPRLTLPPDFEKRLQDLRDRGYPEESIQRIIRQYQGSNFGNLNNPTLNQGPDSLINAQAAPFLSEVGDSTVQDSLRSDSLKLEEKKLEEETKRLIEEGEEERLRQERISDSIRMAQNKIYGHHIFENFEGSFFKDQSNIPSDDYVIGPGDRLTVTIYGVNFNQELLEVRRDGSIIKERLGKIIVNGLSYGTVKNILRTRYRNLYTSSDKIEIILAPNRRTVKVNIVGEVNQSGSYSIFATNNTFTSLFSADGINENGTVRNILVKRNGRTIEEFDMYKYLLEGEIPTSFLQNNDFIFVPVQGKVVKLSGAVKRPMRYELKEDEDIFDALYYAGGVQTNARTNQVQIRRIENGREIFKDIDLDALKASKEGFPLQDGDVILVQSMKREPYNMVQIEGAVKFPDAYEFIKGERIGDLIRKAGGLDTTALMEKAYLTRLIRPGEVEYIDIDLKAALSGDRYHNLELQFFDHLLIFSELDFSEKRYLYVVGEVHKPRRILSSPDLSLKDILFLSGGPTETANLEYVELSTYINPSNNPTIGQFIDSIRTSRFTSDSIGAQPIIENNSEFVLVKRMSITRDWKNNAALDSMLIGKYDQIRFYSEFDFMHLRNISVTGAVRNPDKYTVQQGTSLKDILYRAGGLSEDADVKEVELYKEIDIQKKGFYSTSSSEKEIVRVALEDDWMSSNIADTIDVFSYYKVVVRSERDFVQQGHVHIKGLVNIPGRYPVNQNMTLRDLFYKAGGVKMEADFENIELTRIIEVVDANGRIMPIPNKINQISTTQDWQSDSLLDKILIRPYDQVFIRKNPAFKVQESVFIQGEVNLPGEYNKMDRDDRLSDLIERAEGVTSLAYLQGAYVMRPSVGKIAIELDKALQRKGSKYDRPMLSGDTLYVPPRLDVVTMVGNVMQPLTTVSFDPGKTRFKHYVNLAGGFDRKTKKKLSTVNYMDGRVKRAKSFLGIKIYPKIEQGALIVVERKPEKERRGDGERSRINWQEVQAFSAALLSLILVLNQLTN